MNTTSLIKPAGLTLGLLFAALLSSNALAGPDATATKPCAGAEIVPTTIMKPAMPNGKGPLVAVTGTKVVCQMCPVPTVVTQGAFGNGKGPMKTTEVTTTGVEHNCAKCTGTPKT